MKSKTTIFSSFGIVLFAISIQGCITVEMDLQELTPTQTNNIDNSGLSMVLLTESNLVERKYTESLHRRVERFPPRLILFFSVDSKYAGRQIVIKEMKLVGPDGFSVELVPSEYPLQLKSIGETVRGEYQDYTHLLHRHGDELARAILFTEQIEGIEVGGDYDLTLSYSDINGDVVTLNIDYRADHNKGGFPVPRGLPRT